MSSYRYEFNEAENHYDVIDGARVIGSAECRDDAERWVMAMNYPRYREPQTIESIRSAAVNLRMKLLDVATGATDDDAVHEADQYLYIAHALLQQVECNLILGGYAMRKAVQS